MIKTNNPGKIMEYFMGYLMAIWNIPGYKKYDGLPTGIS
jgi:hypothetical protein